MKEDVVIVGSGARELWPVNFANKENCRWIGVDRAAYDLIEIGIIPDLAVGDFDSMSSMEFSQLKKSVKNTRLYRPEKDDSDTQLALKLALELYPEANYILIGMTGGRLDHLLGNLWLPLEDRFVAALDRIYLQDRQNTVSYYQPGDYLLEKEEGKDFLAFVCLTPVTNLTLKKSKYLLDQKSVNVPTSFMSNEFLTNEMHFSFESGVVAVIQSCDKKEHSY